MVDGHCPRQIIIDAAKGRVSRRRLFMSLSVAVVVVSAQAYWPEMPADAKKKRKKRKKSRGQSGGDGGGSGVSYAPDAEEQAFLREINAYRAQRGLGALELQSQLGAAAESHAATMASQNRGWFHSNLAALLKQFGYTSYRLAGENVAAGYETATQVLAAWKQSPTHDANMLNVTFTAIGIGRAAAANNRWYWSTEFGAK